MRVTITITAEVRHVEGKFAGKEDVAEVLVDELESLDPGTIFAGEHDAEYEIDSWDVVA